MHVPTTCSKKENADTIVLHVRDVIEEAVSRHGTDSHRATTFFNQLALMLIYGGVHHNQLRDCIVKQVGKYLRANVFTPFEILRQMDLAGGRLSYSGVEVLRQCETKGAKGIHTILPSAAALKAYASHVEAYADTFIPFKMIRNLKDHSEGFYFRGADMVTHVLETQDMIANEAQESNRTLSMSMDAARLSNNLTHTLGGFKFNDESNPLKQSLMAVYPQVCILCKETKATTRGIFAMMHKENKEAGDTVLPSEYGVEKISTPFDSDMCSDWKLSDKGGAAKNVTYPCSKCNITSAHLASPNAAMEQCKWCIELGYTELEDWNCYHSSMCTEEFIGKLEVDVKQFKKEMPTISKKLESLWKKSKIKVDRTEDPRLSATPIEKTALTSIHFDIATATIERRRMYSEHLSDDLTIRHMDLSGTMQEQQDRLKHQLSREWSYLDAKDCVDKFGAASVTPGIVMVMESIPCILHMEMRVGIKILTILFQVGLMNAKNNRLDWIPKTQRTSLKKKCDAFIKRVGATINKEILGTTDLSFQWEVPMDKKTKTITEVSMKNGQIRKCIKSIDLLIDLCIAKKHDNTTWKTSMEEYSLGMDLVKRKGDLSQEEVLQFQRLLGFSPLTRWWWNLQHID